MEQRKHPRMVVYGMTIDVSDGIGCCSGVVCDVSRVGMCLADLARKFGKKTNTYTVVASKAGRNFKFRVRPRWEVAGRLHKKVGVEIYEAPRQWTEYVLSLESGQRKQ